MSNTVCQPPGCLAVKDIPAVIANLESGVHAFWEENGFFPKTSFRSQGNGFGLGLYNATNTIQKKK